MASHPQRQLIGALALVIALLAMLIMPRLLAPDEAGTAQADPALLPPQVGTCVLTPQRGAEVVPCTEPHDAEITLTAGSEELTDSVCSDAAADYVGTGIGARENSIGSWTPIPPYYRGLMIGGPDLVVPTALTWQVCAVTPPRPQQYRGSVHDVGVQIGLPRPGPFGTCLAPGPEALRELQYSSCADPHRIEFLGSLLVTPAMAAAGRVDVDTSDQALREQCRDLAATISNRADPTFDGQLQIVVEAVWQRGIPAGPVDPTAEPSQLILPDCLVEVVGQATLTGSIVGIGDSPLPLG